MILGHLTVTSAGHHLLKTRVWPSFPLAMGPLLVGAYLPDLLDKPLAILTGLSGRGYGHSLLVQIVFFTAGWLVLGRRSPRTWAALALGTLLHLIQDTVRPVVLLAPLLGPIPFEPMEPLLVKLARFYTSGSLLMWLEVAGAAYWLGVGATAGVERVAARRRSHQRIPSSSAL